MTVFVGNVSGSLQITAAYSASGGFFSGCSGTNSVSATTFVNAAGSSSFSPSSSVYPSGQARSMVLRLSKAASAPITFNLSASGAGATGTTFPASLTIPAGASGQAFTVVGGDQGDLTFSATSTNTAQFTSPAPVTVRVAAFFGLVGTNPGAVMAGSRATFNAGLQNSTFGARPTTIPFTTSLALSGATGSTLSPSSLGFAVGDTSQAFTMTAGPNVGDATLSFSTSSPYVLTSGSYIIRVRGTSTISGAPATLEPGQTSGPITVQLSHPSPTAFTAPLTLGSNPSGSSLSTTALAFGVGEQSKTFTVTAGPNNDTTIAIGTSASVYFDGANATILVKATTAPTPVGTNVMVEPPMPEGVDTPVTVTYSEVTTAGVTKLTTVATPVAPPSGYEVPGTPLYFGLSTTAATAGATTVCSQYPNGIAADETGLRLFMLGPQGWVDTTVSVDAAGNVICGTTGNVNGATFAIFRLNSAPVVGDITGPTGIVMAGDTLAFSATFTDADAADTHTGTWVWGDGTTSDATIAQVDGVWTATGEHAFAGGTHQVSLVITDGGQPAAADNYQVIADGAAPVINALTATPESLWPPDSKMHEVVLTITATDDTGIPVCEVTGVAVSASQNAKQAASVVTGPLSVQLKAFPHTSYAITVTCTDAVSRTTEKSVTVSIAQQKKVK